MQKRIIILRSISVYFLLVTLCPIVLFELKNVKFYTLEPISAQVLGFITLEREVISWITWKYKIKRK